MEKSRILRSLKIFGLFLCILFAVIIAIALFDPNLKNLVSDNIEFVASNIDKSEETHSHAEVSKPKTPSKTESKPSSNSETEEETDNLIIQTPNPFKGEDICEKCYGSRTMVCPSCNGGGIGVSKTCQTCFGNGKIPCEYCK